VAATSFIRQLVLPLGVGPVSVEHPVILCVCVCVSRNAVLCHN